MDKEGEYSLEEISNEVAATKDLDSQEATKEDEFTQIEQAVHNVAIEKVEESGDDYLQNKPELVVEESDLDEDTIVDEITNSLAQQEETQYQSGKNGNAEKKKLKLWMKIAIPVGSLVFLLFCTYLFIRYTTPGQRLAVKLGAGIISERTNYDDGSDVVEQEVPDITDVPELVEDLPELTEEEINLDAESGTARHEDYAVNILLLGEEAIDSGTSRGRTDVMLIATLNSKEKSVKLTSLMRDMYVQIPGHLDNKLNSAYSTGGIPLLYETIELNFDIKLDGYCLVGFNNFEKIIDALDGVDITLTSGEADYLNNNNYVSNVAYRTLKPGVNHMNGNQALGYCRIRYVGTGVETDDFGRTSRHRNVMNAIFEKYKTLSLWDLALKVNSCLPMITTDLDAQEIEDYLRLAMDIGLSRLEQLRIPADGTYEDALVRKMRVIVPNLQDNIDVLHKFIFGSEE